LEVDVREHASGLRGLGTVLLDEILPIEDGCSQEIAFVGGKLYVECADLQASWVNRS
jgi:hypothetical protein